MSHPTNHAGADDADILHVSGLREMADGLELVICDLWGVMHNGVHASDEAVAAILAARDAGIRSVFLSNAPRPRYHVRDQLLAMGMPHELTDYVVTSGGLARDAVRAEFDGAALYHLGPAEDENTLAGLPVDRVSNPADADVILATGLNYRDVEQHRGMLRAPRDRRIPFLCANPDRVVHVGDKLYLCAGVVADLYETMGGLVTWFGKPMPTALHACVAEVGLSPDVPGEHVVMIGDSLQTDIAGACAAGFSSLFVTGGIHRAEWPLVRAAMRGDRLLASQFAEIFGATKPVPEKMLEQLRW